MISGKDAAQDWKVRELSDKEIKDNQFLSVIDERNKRLERERLEKLHNQVEKEKELHIEKEARKS